MDYNRRYDSYPARQQVGKYPTTTYLVLRHEVLTTTNFKITVFWDVPWCLVKRQQSSAGTCCLHVEEQKFSTTSQTASTLSFLHSFWGFIAANYSVLIFFCNNEVFFNNFMQKAH